MIIGFLLIIVYLFLSSITELQKMTNEKMYDLSKEYVIVIITNITRLTLFFTFCYLTYSLIIFMKNRSPCIGLCNVKKCEHCNEIFSRRIVSQKQAEEEYNLLLDKMFKNFWCIGFCRDSRCEKCKNRRENEKMKKILEDLQPKEIKINDYYYENYAKKTTNDWDKHHQIGMGVRHYHHVRYGDSY